MGCVLTKRATQDHSSNKSSSARHNVEQVVCSSDVTSNAKDEVANKINQSVTEAPASNRRKPKPGFSLKTNNGWPSWLCDVAGDAIKDWTPRRANTFEKIDKVNPRHSILYIIYAKSYCMYCNVNLYGWPISKPTGYLIAMIWKDPLI